MPIAHNYTIFLIMPIARPCSLNFAGLEKLLVIGKNHSFMSSKYVAQAVHRYKRQKLTLKTC